MRQLGPRVMTPRDGRDWLLQALQLMLRRPGLFLATALLAPAGSAALLLLMGWWDSLWPLRYGWLSVIVNVSCYGLPLSLTVNLACGFARVANRGHLPSWRQLWIPTVFRVLTKTSLFMFALLLQGYLTIYLIRHLVAPPTPTLLTLTSSFGVTDTILGTQLSMVGGLLLVMQFLFVGFVVPLHLFRELSLFECWTRSFLAIQLNPWLVPVLGGIGLVLIFLPFVFSFIGQVLALPLPAYLGAVLYVAWKEVFQGGTDDEEEELEEATTWRLPERFKQPATHSTCSSRPLRRIFKIAKPG